MTNYFVINRPSNLVEGVVAMKYSPTDTKVTKFVEANDKLLTYYYKLLKQRPEILPDIGELMAKSAYLTEAVSGGSYTGQAKPMKLYHRDERPEPSVVDRKAQITEWINAYPNCNVYDVDDMFQTGTTAALAYIKATLR